jgi:type II secretory pathway pseudopilin PulG
MYAVRGIFAAIDRGKLKRTMADMRSIAASLERYRTDHQGYPVADSIETLASELCPKYLRVLPEKDSWDKDFQIRSTAASYTLYTVGKDGYGSDCTPGVTTKPEDETCIVDGTFVRYPEGSISR